MEHAALASPSLTIAIAVVVGIAMTILAVHLRVPSIVLLLAAGAVLGPDGVGLIQTEALGPGLATLVDFAVAVILFEGGLNLHYQSIRKAEAPIRRLITVGAIMTMIGATASAMAVMQWPFSRSILFGTLVIVTGPTVIGPLLKRLRVEQRVSTILEAEGVLIDPIGAIIAAVTLELVIELHDQASVMNQLSTIAMGAAHLALKLLIGTLIGAAGGWLISKLLRVRNLISEELENIFVLSMVFAMFEISELATPESGIAAVAVAGIVVRYLGTPVQHALREFKEQLTVLLIALLFVLLAADVQLTEVQALGWRGVVTTMMLMAIVRPLSVYLSVFGTGLGWRRAVFLGWIGPRGIVAAAVASWFAIRMDQHGIEGGTEVRALVFLVIAMTVLWSGVTGGLAASALHLKRQQLGGWVILGAHPLARLMASMFRSAGEEVVLIDANADQAVAAQKAGFRVLHGNGLSESVLRRAQLPSRRGIVAMTPNDEINLLFVRRVRAEVKLPLLYVTSSSLTSSVSQEMIHSERAEVNFGRSARVARWNHAVGSKNIRIVRAVRKVRRGHVKTEDALGAELKSAGLPLLMLRGGEIHPVGDSDRFVIHDEVIFLVKRRRAEDAMRYLEATGWEIKVRTRDEFTEELPVATTESRDYE